MGTLSPRWTRLRYRLYGPLYDHLARPLEGGRRRAVDALDLSAGDRVLAPAGRVSVYDKFVAPDERASLARRALNPLTRFLFSDVTRSLDPLLAAADLTVTRRESALGGLYTVARLDRPGGGTASVPV